MWEDDVIVALPHDVRERLDRIEAEEGVPPIEIAYQAIIVFSQLTGPERHALGMTAISIVMERHYRR